MDLFHRSSSSAALLLASLAAIGCANPGPPRSPSLHLPETARDLTAVRSGDTVEVRFTVPSRSTDKLPLHGSALTATLCRELDHQTCMAIPAFTATTVALAAPTATPTVVVWKDHLPAPLAAGAPHLLGYRVELFNVLGRSAGMSDPAFTVAGQAPTAVTALHAQGSREGIVLSWNAAPHAEGEVLLQREGRTAAPKAATPHQASPLSPHKESDNDTVWLDPHADDTTRTLDTAVLPDVPYRYIAVRQRTLQIGGRTMQLRSAESDPLSFTLRQIYPPVAPTGLVAAGFTAQAGTPFAVDLVWQPVDDAKLAGYNVYRQKIDEQGFPVGERARLNEAVVPLPGFHDTTANDGTRYRYSVTAVDPQGNESEATTSVLEPTGVQ